MNLSRQNYCIAAVAIILAIVLYLNTFEMNYTGYLLPRGLSWLIVIMAIAMMAETFCKRAKLAAEDKERPEIKKMRVFVVILMILAYISTINILGYLITTPIFIISIYTYLKAMTLHKSALIGIGFTLFIYLVFVAFLQLPIKLLPID